MARFRRNTIAGSHSVIADFTEWAALNAGASALGTYAYRNGVAHLLIVGEPNKAARLLTDFGWAMARLRTQGVAEVPRLHLDYVATTLCSGIADRKSLETWADFFRERLHLLALDLQDWPAHRAFLQLAVEQADESPVSRQAEAWLAAGSCDWLWMRNVHRPVEAPANPCEVVLHGHTGAVSGALAVGNRLLSWSSDEVVDGTLRLWDLTTAKCVAVMQASPADRRGDAWAYADAAWGALAIDQSAVLSWHKSGSIRVWDLGTGERRDLPGHLDAVRGVSRLSHSDFLSWSNDGSLRLWNTRSGACRVVLEGHSRAVYGALPLPGGRLLSWSQDGTLRVWDLESGRCEQILTGHLAAVEGAVVFADGRAASWASDGPLRVWDAGGNGSCRILPQLGAPVASACVLPSGTLLAWSREGTLATWTTDDATTLSARRRIEGGLSGVLSTGSGHLVCWNGRRLHVLSSPTDESPLVLDHGAEVQGASLLPDASLLSWSGTSVGGSILRRWDLTSGRRLQTLRGHTGWINGVDSSAPGRLLTWSNDGTLRVWNLATATDALDDARHLGHVRGALDTGTGYLLSWAHDPDVKLWSLAGGTHARTLRTTMASIGGVLQFPNGALISWSENGQAQICTPDEESAFTPFFSCAPRVNGVALLRSGDLLCWGGTGVSESAENRIEVRDSRSGRCHATLTGHSGGVSGAVELADGGILSWSKDATLRIWDYETERCTSLLVGHTEPVRGALQLQDSRLLSWSQDGTLRLWSASGAPIQVIAGPGGRIEGVTVLANGTWLVRTKDALALWRPDAQRALYLQSLTAAPRLAPALAVQLGATFVGEDSFDLLDDSSLVKLSVFSSAPAEGGAGQVALWSLGSRSQLLHADLGPVCSWVSDSPAVAIGLWPVGRAAAGLHDGRVAILQVYDGNSPVDLVTAVHRAHTRVTEMLRAEVQAGSRRSEVRHELALRLLQLSCLDGDTCQTPDVVELAKESLAILAPLVTTAEFEEDLVSELSVMMSRFGREHLFHGRSVPARMLLAEVVQLDRRLASRDPTLSHLLGASLVDLALAEPDDNTAVTLLQEALALRLRRVEEEPTNPIARMDAAEGLALLARLHVRRGALELAAAALDQFRSVAPPAPAGDRDPAAPFDFPGALDAVATWARPRGRLPSGQALAEFARSLRKS